MSAIDDYCELCDLPLSQCVHGRPVPAAPAVPVKPPSKPRQRAVGSSPKPAATKRPAATRWTPPEVLSPIIVDVLREAGGELGAEDLLARVREVIGDGLRPGDEERTPAGELRWHYAARRARQALIAEGVMTTGRPGVWQLGSS